jgi:cobalt-zinc-cadmium resistance protein CzcA
MIRRIVDASLDNRLLVLVLWGLLAVFGTRAALQLPIDAVPDVTNVQVQVLTDSPGLAPEEVERFVTFPVETALSGLPRVEELRSVTRFGLSVVTVVFEEGSDIYWARQLVAERLTEAREGIPPGYGEPELGPISTGLGEIYQFEVRGEPRCPEGGLDTAACYSPMELRTILDWQVVPALRAVPGVVEVNSMGGLLKTYQVTLDPLALTAHQLSAGAVLAALRANNRNVGGGYIEHQGEQYLIRGEGLVEGLEDIGSIVLAHDSAGTPVYVRNVATVEVAPMLRQGAVTRGGEGEAVVGVVMMLLGENSRTVVERVKEKVARVQRSLPPGVTLEAFYDRTELVRRTIRTVARNLSEGGLLVVVVLLLLLGSVRGGLIVASAIPLSMLGAFIAMERLGISGNLMSLGAIDFGLIVDGSVVMVENIVRAVHERRESALPHLEKVRQAAHQVARPVAFAVGIIILVYLPVLALRGIEGKMFRPMALTVMFALGASLLCALTLMPVLASLLLKRVPHTPPLLLRWVRRLYGPVLDGALAHRRRTAVAALALFAASLGLVPFLGAEFLPRLDEGAIAMQIWRLPSISLEQSNRISSLAERVVREEFGQEVEAVVSRTGRAEIATDPMGVEISDTYVLLRPRAEWRYGSKEELVEALEETLRERVPGALFSFSQPIELRVSELISGVRSDVGIQLYGDDLALLEAKAREVARVVVAVPGAADVKVEQTSGLPMLRVRVDRAAAARYGINAEDVLEVVEAIGGVPAGLVFEGQQRFRLQARFAPAVRQEPARVRDLRVAAPPAEPGGVPRLVPLSQVAAVMVEEGPAQISRENVSRRISVEANVRGRDLGRFVAEARREVERRVALPPGWTLEWGGQFENLQAASRRLALLVPLALDLIFVLLYSAFGSTRLALLIFLNVPLAVTGGIAALAVRGYPFSISAGVGFIALFGVAVLNGVVLVSHVLERHREGLPALEAARQGARARLRPVLMTALVASLGFLPMALATSAGAEVQRPLATVVIGGLVTSTLLTLLVLPALYPWVMGWGKEEQV